MIRLPFVQVQATTPLSPGLYLNWQGLRPGLGRTAADCWQKAQEWPGRLSTRATNPPLLHLVD